MTKQKEIREGIKIILKSAGANEGWALNILGYLHSQDVVIKERCHNCQDGYIVWRDSKRRCSVCKGKGCVVESLIKERK